MICPATAQSVCRCGHTIVARLQWIPYCRAELPARHHAHWQAWQVSHDMFHERVHLYVDSDVCAAGLGFEIGVKLWARACRGDIACEGKIGFVNKQCYDGIMMKHAAA
jgi:hypothetical protein